MNSGPLVPQTSALTRLRHAPSGSHFSSPRDGLSGGIASDALAGCARLAGALVGENVCRAAEDEGGMEVVDARQRWVVEVHFDIGPALEP